MKNLLITVLIYCFLFLLQSCSDDKGNNPSTNSNQSSKVSANAYSPLSIGDYRTIKHDEFWSHSIPTYHETISISLYGSLMWNCAAQIEEIGSYQNQIVSSPDLISIYATTSFNLKEIYFEGYINSNKFEQNFMYDFYNQLNTFNHANEKYNYCYCKKDLVSFSTEYGTFNNVKEMWHEWQDGSVTKTYFAQGIGMIMQVLIEENGSIGYKKQLIKYNLK